MKAFDSAEHASCNRTCELGMTRATGHDYRHVLDLLDEATGGRGAPGTGCLWRSERAPLPADPGTPTTDRI